MIKKSKNEKKLSITTCSDLQHILVNSKKCQNLLTVWVHNFTEYKWCWSQECIISQKFVHSKKLRKNFDTTIPIGYTNICGPSPTTYWNGQQYFITFIDDNNILLGLPIFDTWEVPIPRRFLRLSRLRLNFNLERRLRLSNLTVVVSTMANMMDQENNIQDLLRFSSKSVELFHNTLCQANLAWMV